MLDCVGQPLRNEALEQGALSLVRRADWRFLLPNPGIGRVAYLAPHDAELVAALNLVSTSVELLDAPAEPRGCELVVLTAAGASSLPARELRCLPAGSASSRGPRAVVAVNRVAAYLAAHPELARRDGLGVGRQPSCVLLNPRFRGSRHVIVLV